MNEEYVLVPKKFLEEIKETIAKARRILEGESE
jgi:hypothetical protein